MHGELHGTATDRDPHTGRFVAGNHGRFTKQLRIAAKAEELRHEYFPGGGATVMDANRLLLAARHYVIAETARDPVVSQRSTRLAEYLLSKVRREEAPLPTLEELGLE
jgi:hypothetical protein